MNSARVTVTRADCRGCINNGFNVRPTGCWCLPTARFVVLYRAPDTQQHRRAAFEAVTRPHCFSQSGYVHLRAIPEGAR